MGWFDANSGHWNRTGVLVAVVGVLIAAVPLWFLFRPSNSSNSTPTPTAVISQDVSSSSDQASTDSTGEETDEPTLTTPSEEPSSYTNPDDEQPTGVASIHVSFDDVVSFRVGTKVGPATWQLSNWGGKLEADISVAWEARTTDNVRVDGDTCEVLISISGSTDEGAQRSSKCSQGHVSGFREEPVIFRMHKPGTYTVTVRDKVSGIEGTAQFNVVA